MRPIRIALLATGLSLPLLTGYFSLPEFWHSPFDWWAFVLTLMSISATPILINLAFRESWGVTVSGRPMMKMLTIAFYSGYFLCGYVLQFLGMFEVLNRFAWVWYLPPVATTATGWLLSRAVSRGAPLPQK